MKQTVFCALFLLFSTYVFANPALIRPDNLVNNGATCRDGYSQPFESNWTSCYKVYLIDTHREQATNKCQSDGGFLTSVPNAFVNSFINSLALELDVSYLMLGISCTNGTCVNDDGTKLQYTNFLPGQKSDGCAFMSLQKKDGQKWYMWDCNFGEFFACEIPAGAVKEYTCPQDYSYVDGGCYKFVNIFPNNISGNAAAADCQKVPGGNLATINSSEVNTFLADQKPHNPWATTAFGLLCPKITKDGDMSSCKWDDGTPFGYNAFVTEFEYNRWWNFPLAEMGSGCCDFNGGKWENCYPCNNQKRFNSYICQVPVQTV